MDNLKVFLLRNEHEKPPISKSNLFAKAEMSDFYLALIETISGVKKPGLISFDYRNEIWRSAQAGTFKVLEWYEFLEDQSEFIDLRDLRASAVKNPPPHEP